jgi:hypothetical protein
MKSKGEHQTMPRIRIPRSWGPEEALTVAYFLDDVARAIWKTHGHAMADYLQCLVDDGGALPRARIDPHDHDDPNTYIPF